MVDLKMLQTYGMGLSNMALQNYRFDLADRGHLEAVFAQF